jgi:hypothetical protein
MGFVVTHRGELTPEQALEFTRQVTRAVLHSGGNIDRVPRVREDGPASPWLYVWDTEAAAQAFIEGLPRHVRKLGWTIQPAEGEPTVGPWHPLEVNATAQSDSWLFSLEPLTRKAIQSRFPDSCQHRSVHIVYQDRAGAEAGRSELATLAWQILPLLTGLSAERLRPFGSFRIINPTTDEELVPALALEPVSAG